MNIQFSINPHVFIHHLASQHLRYRDVAALCFWFPRTWHFPLGTFCSFNRDGYQYETKPQTNGGRGYAELLFFPTAEGYVKALYKDDPSDHAPAAYQYVYIYKDHLGNNRLSYTFDPETNQIKILEENHYYPFGLKHGSYNAIRKDVKYKEQAASKKEVKQVAPEAVKFKYYYQEQERQDELGLNWDSFKYRNYDYAIGRFMSVDPLAEKYAYNGVYNFSENRVLDARELEGLEAKLIVEKGNYAEANVGHTFVSVGSGKNQTVYTYGRWAGTNPSSGSSHTPLNNGRGIMVKLTGEDAKAEISKYVNKYDAKVFELTHVDEHKVQNFLESEFNKSSKTPDKGKYKGDKRAHDIDNYDLTSNNCTTKSLKAIEFGNEDNHLEYHTTVSSSKLVGGKATVNMHILSISPTDLYNQLNTATEDVNSGIKDDTNTYKEN